MSLSLGQTLESAYVVIIDDSRSFLSGLKTLILPSVKEISIFLDGTSALTSLTNRPPDLIVTDLEMVGISGLELIRQIKTQTSLSTVPILAVTGSNTSDSMTEAIEAGADGFITKNEIRSQIIPRMLTLMRTKQHYQHVTAGLQLKAIKSLIGTYKHEFGNAIAAIDGKLRRLERTHPIVGQDEAYLALQKWNLRLQETLQKLDDLRNFEEENYAKNSKILKVG